MTAKVVYGIIGAILSFFAPISSWLLACAFMVFCDLITGLWAARAKGEMWTSNKLRKSLTKCTSYLSLIICARVFEGVLPSYVEQAEITRAFAGLICGVELYSMAENMLKTTGNRVFYILTQFTTKKLKDISGKDLEEAIEKKDKK